MGTPPDPDPVHALIVVDLQSAFVEGEGDGTCEGGAVPDAARVVERARELLARARAAGAPVVHLQNDGEAGAPDEPDTPGWRLVLPVRPGEAVLRKTDDDGFWETGLEALLRGHGVTAVALCGVQSEMCVRATAQTALDLDFRVVLPHDAHGTYDVPPAPGDTAGVPAALAARVAEWSLGDEVEITAAARDVRFTAPFAAPVTARARPTPGTSG
ncbi:isochorismatase family cysteine hydrolase [Streptomyces boncukensis]|uniref:Cysteine hydrolase n=1 Tax=Streptomyces boncukensis TaxID=2711219 RepID=A0A6G4X7D2_9ACTN|nr:isochorismatase family cysteine hydrolase [Streptomyces boncukensis]NGO73163.1 cysteine hydrolase [Streptomyces boncukensis]